MKIRSFLQIAMVAMALTGFAASAKKPNVLFILADDLGIGGLHCYGTDWLETPNIDTLCAEGMHFTSGLAAYPTCRPSRAALLTGQYGPRTGVYRVKDSYGDEDKAKLVIPENHQLSTDKTTLGTAFRKAGYATAMYGKWHVSNEHQIHPGEYFGYDEAYVSAGAHYNAKSLPPVELPDGMMIEELYSGKASAFMEKSVKAEKPFFIYMPYFLVHGPAEARPDYIEHFKKKLKGLELEKGGKEIEVTAAMTRMLDDFVGMLLAKVKELGIEKDTIVVFTSDNGSYDPNLVGGYRGRKGDTYDGGMRVPYIFKWPGKIKAGDVRAERIIGVDVYPTLLGLVGVEKPAGYPLDGVDLTPLLTGKAKGLPPRGIYCFYPKYVRFSKKTQRWAYSWRNVIYDGDFKLIEYPEYDEFELFNLAADPKEETDLAQSSPERRQALTAKLHRWLKDVGAPKREPNPDYSLQEQPQKNIKKVPVKSAKKAKLPADYPAPLKRSGRAKTIQFGGNILKVNPAHPVADSSTGWWGDWSIAATQETGSRRGKAAAGKWFEDITGALSIRATAFSDYASRKPGTLAVKKSRLGVADSGAAEIQPGEALVLEFDRAVRLHYLTFFGTPNEVEVKLTVAGNSVPIKKLQSGQVYSFKNPPLLHPGQTVVLGSTDSYMLYSAVVEPSGEAVGQKETPAVQPVISVKPGMADAALPDDNFEIQEFKVDKSIELPTASKKAQEAWKDQRFGMFIHWGPISQLGQQLSHSRNSPSHRIGGKPYKVAQLEPEVYDVQYKTFNPVKFDPDEMMKMAKAAGVSYIVFTAKHHAGFSMFDSAVTDYDIMNTPYKKDITKMLSDAARANGMKFGFYYSPRDWHHPDCDSDENHPRYIKFYKAQMNELLNNYGPIYSIFFDGLGPGDWGNTAAEVMGTIRKLHPDCMVNDRGGAGADYYTPEHNISYFNRDQSWEACHTTTGQWGYNPKVGPKKIEQLMEILLYTWGGDGNMLLNIGPMGDGRVNPAERANFEKLAEWWAVHGEESIRGSRGGPYIPGPWGVATCKDKRAFLHIFRWPESGALEFPKLEGLTLKSARVLSGGDVECFQTSEKISVKVPKAGRGKILTTVELTFDKPVYPVAPLQRVPSLTKSAKLTASHNAADLDNLTDQNVHTQWEASLAKGEKEFWIEASWDSPQAIGSFSIARGEDWVPKHTVEIQVPDGSSGWKTITPKSLKLKWETMKFLEQPITTDRIRLRITGTKKFIFTEFELFAPVN